MNLLKKIKKLCWILGSCICFSCLSHAGEVIWHPLLGNDADDWVPIIGIAQIGSEVHLNVFMPTIGNARDLPSNRVPVEFPSLFVVSCDYGSPQEPDVVIEPGNGSYDYDVGNGWIYHRKGPAGSGEESLGWIYIKNYPWILTDVGWTYVVEAGIFENSNAWWFYEQDYGWYFSTRDLFPIIYHGLGWTRYKWIHGQ